jgi:hypothetical protein
MDLVSVKKNSIEYKQVSTSLDLLAFVFVLHAIRHRRLDVILGVPHVIVLDRLTSIFIGARTNLQLVVGRQMGL